MSNESKAEIVSNLGAGNGGHDRNSPRWQLMKDLDRRGNLPKVLQDILDNLFDYYADPEALPSLAHLNTSATNQDGKRRSNRSEAREAECLVMASIIHTLDLTTLRIGTPIKGTGECVYRSVKELAEMCGLMHPTSGKPLHKFTAAFVRLQQAGYVNTKTVAGTNKKGEVRRRNSAKVATETMMVALLGGTLAAQKALKKARDSHSQATKRRYTKTHDQAVKTQRDNFHAKALESAAIKQAEKATQVEQASAKPMTPPAHSARHSDYIRARQQYHNKLIQSDLSPAQLNAELRKFPALDNWNQ